jgi:peptidyl-prolyl cis-trans isomerase A (cyclophilin A)
MKYIALLSGLVLIGCTAEPEPVSAPVEDPHPNVVLETELGEIEIEVYPDTAPISAGDFLAHVDQGLYDGEGFYRVVRPDNDPRDMGMSLIQGGILSQDLALPPIEHERTTTTGLSNVRGTVSIARLEPGTGSAGYFFINIGDNDFLDTGGARNPDGEGYASFGTVVRGMAVIEAIQSQEAGGESPDPVTDNQYLTEPVIITRAYRVE